MADVSVAHPDPTIQGAQGGQHPLLQPSFQQDCKLAKKSGILPVERIPLTRRNNALSCGFSDVGFGNFVCFLQ